MVTTFPRHAFVGFDHLFDQLETGTHKPDLFPPHNILDLQDDKYAIEIALAGFTIDDIEAEVDKNQLTITGKKAEDDGRKFVYKGISARRFQRKFTLADHVVVTGADMVNGVLTVYLEKLVPEELKPRKIDISHEKQLLLG